MLDHSGNKDTSHAVPESLCCELLENLCSMLGLGFEVLAPGPVVSSLGCFKDSLWLRKTPTSTSTNGCEVPFPLGITASIPPGGVFPTVSPQCVGREADRLRYLNAKVWDAENYSSYQEHKEKADKVLQTEIDEGYVQWAPSRVELEREVGSLHLAKMAVVVKGEKSTPYSRHDA